MFTGKAIDFGLPGTDPYFILFLMPPIPLTMNTRYLLAVTVGVPEEPKEGIAETSSKFFGSVYLKNPSHYLMNFFYFL